MVYTYIKAEQEGGIARIIFNRPKHNMLSIAMIKEINLELEKLLVDNSLKCLVFSGDGASFCAGVDVADHKPEVVDDMITTFNRLFELVAQCEIPTIAAVHGYCLGGGMEVAIACDMIIAAKGASFGQPEIKLGFLPPYAAIRLPKLVGQAKALEICITGKRYTAEEARSLGFVSQVADDDKFSAEVEKLIGEIKSSSPIIIRLNKRAVRQNLDKGFAEALADSGDLFLKGLAKTEDFQEGMNSYFEKRKPEWKNR
jgi:cyclohexa-1,5-dienecarbonyl-CoA hydratase